MGAGRMKTSPVISMISDCKPRILLLADGANWIFERHCYTIKKLLSQYYQFTISYASLPFEEDEYDLIYPLEWNLVAPDRIKNPLKYVTGIRGHVRWPELDFRQFVAQLRGSFQRVHVVSSRLLQIFKPHIPSVIQLSHGVDTQFFQRPPTLPPSGSMLRIGWAGNKKAPADKGFSEFIEPLSQLPDVEVVSAGYDGRLLDMVAMREFYSSIDVYVCASLQEGNCNPLLESAAMGLAIVTSDNGTVPEYLIHGKNALVIDRQQDAFRRAIEFFRDNPQARAVFGREARKSVLEKWDWSLMAGRHRQFFDEALAFQAKTLQQMASLCLSSDREMHWYSSGCGDLRSALSLSRLLRPGATEVANSATPQTQE